MYNAAGEVIYVGKAGNLRKRLSSYFSKNPSSPKTRALVNNIEKVEVILTNTEREALLLEYNLIKEFRPRYNVLLRDDKSYPYIYISENDAYPRLAFHRGSRKPVGKYIGPYPNVHAVRQSLRNVQKLFQVRQCTDAYFNNRTRPCLQYQIKRCSGSCVGLIDQATYHRDLEHTKLMLAGKNQRITKQLINDMDKASANLAFEEAARLRDQIANIKSITEKQYISGERGDIDVVACALNGGHSCVQIFFIRNGMNLGNKSFFPSTPGDTTPEEVLYSFVTQFYLQHEIPREILLSHSIDGCNLLQQVLSERCQRAIKISPRPRGKRSRWLNLASHNAESALASHLSSRSGQARRLDDLKQVLALDDTPSRMECFDISHTHGESTVASCAVFNAEGPLKQSYRRFNITDITPGDDYAAMRQAIDRRYTRVVKEEAPLPDVLFIDGGKGQVSAARSVLDELQLDSIVLVGVAKGIERIAGNEVLIVSETQQELSLGKTSPALHLIQQIRDEAHRFAITGHRTRRSKKRQRSVLEDIPGLGPKRRKALLSHFGGIQGIQRAGVEDMAAVDGISRHLATLIYDNFHPTNS